MLAWPRAARPGQCAGRDHECVACRAAWGCVTARRRCAQVHNVAGLEKHKLELKYDTFSQMSVIEHEARLNRFLKAKWAADSFSVRTPLQICNLTDPQSKTNVCFPVQLRASCSQQRWLASRACARGFCAPPSGNVRNCGAVSALLREPCRAEHDRCSYGFVARRA